MAKDPAFLFYSSDFLTGVSDLTMEERGQYITLLCLQHQKGRLTRKMIDLGVPGVSDDVLLKFSKDEDGSYYNERLETEAEKRRKHSKLQSERAKKRWDKKKGGKGSGNTSADAAALPVENVNENGNSNSLSIKDKLPSVLEFVQYGLENAKEKGLNISDTSLELKFQAWKENGWKNGNGRPIKNWKSSLLNTLKYLHDDKPITTGQPPRKRLFE